MSTLSIAEKTYRSLLSRIQTKSAKVGVIGLGYVGQPLGVGLSSAGFAVTGFDLSRKRRDELALEGWEVSDPADGGGSAHGQDAAACYGEMDVLIICVPTPLGEQSEPDLRCVRQAAEQIAAQLRHAQLIVLESTSYPGTTRNVLQPILESSGLQAGRDFFLAYSPERQDPGRQTPTLAETPKLIAGLCLRASTLTETLYGSFFETLQPTESPEVAEAAKLLENVFRAVNIALVNELKVLFDSLELPGTGSLDIWKVIEAAGTKPFGFMKFEPGPGPGGHCIPVDPHYLAWLARSAAAGSNPKAAARMVQLASEINRSMPDYVIERTLLALNSKGLALRGSKLLVLGLAYKPGVSDVRESPAVQIIERLQELGARVAYSDPHVAYPPRHLTNLAALRSQSLEPQFLSSVDAVLLITDHSEFDYDAIAANAPLVIDTRNALASRMAGRANYFRA